MKKILLVEDDEKLSKLIAEYLTNHGYEVIREGRGDKAIYRIRHENYLLVILDINLPEVDGLQICKLVRRDYPGFILMLTAREADEDHISGLEFGADDYVNKPIQPKVLLARIGALLKRPQCSPSTLKQLKFGGLFIDVEQRIVTLDNKSIDLKPKEFDLLTLLALNAGKCLSRDNIMYSLRGVDYDGVDRTIDLRISYLRKKLGDSLDTPYKIITVRNRGYLLVTDAWS